jgi:hypothetical protein
MFTASFGNEKQEILAIRRSGPDRHGTVAAGETSESGISIGVEIESTEVEKPDQNDRQIKISTDG